MHRLSGVICAVGRSVPGMQRHMIPTATVLWCDPQTAQSGLEGHGFEWTRRTARRAVAALIGRLTRVRRACRQRAPAHCATDGWRVVRGLARLELALHEGAEGGIAEAIPRGEAEHCEDEHCAEGPHFALGKSPELLPPATFLLGGTVA